jgi:hypothetical protein
MHIRKRLNPESRETDPKILHLVEINFDAAYEVMCVIVDKYALRYVGWR